MHIKIFIEKATLQYKSHSMFYRMVCYVYAKEVYFVFEQIIHATYC